jgi:ornithine carrier protein
MASFILTPIELVKCKMQVQQIGSTQENPKRLNGPIGLVRSIISKEGITGLWLGQTGTLLRETGGSAVWFCTFESMVALFVRRRQESIRSSERVTKDHLSSLELMISGGTAGIFYNLVFFPADSIKSTLQTASELLAQPDLHTNSPSHHQFTSKGFLNIGGQIVKARGWKGLYAGCGITCLRSAPSSALIFWIVSRLESRFG